MKSRAIVTGMAVTAALWAVASPALAAANWASNGGGKSAAKAGSLSPTTGFSAVCTSPGVASSQADLSWTASPTTAVTGYKIVRTAPSTTTQTYNVSGRTTVTYHDSNAVTGSNKTYTYTIRAVVGSWQSSAQTDTVSTTPSSGLCNNT